MLLIKFSWQGGVAERLTQLLGDAGCPLLSLQRGIEVEDGYAYLDADAAQGAGLKAALGAHLHGIAVIDLAPLQEVEGASASAAAPYHYVVETDVLSDMEDGLNAWYREEHLPGLASVPGTVRAARYRNTGALDAGPRYHACYDLVTPETLGSPPWLKVRGTAWSSRVRPAFRNTRRTMFRRVMPE